MKATVSEFKRKVFGSPGFPTQSVVRRDCVAMRSIFICLVNWLPGCSLRSNFELALCEVMQLLLPHFLMYLTILGVSAACRESFCVFTFRTCFITQPAVRYTYCQRKARYSWSIFQKTSPYKLLRRPVQQSSN